MKNLLLIFIFLLICIPLFSGGQPENIEPPVEKESRVIVFTSILPQKYFVERIGGDRVDINVFVGPGKNPATYDPTPSQVVSLSRADIFFSIGVPFERAFIGNIGSSLPELNIVDTSAGIVKREIVDHDHEEEGDHLEGDLKDPHIWMSPDLVKIQAATIFNALVKNDPDGKEIYTIGYNSFIEDLNLVHNELQNILEPLGGNVFFVFHPSFGYFADEFGLRQVAIETGGKEPGPSMLEKIIMDAREKNVKIIFVQPEFSQKSAQVIAKAIDGAVVILDPLNPDYLSNLRRIAFEIEKAFN
ncbi:MAG: zinc ABC transporter substrate-binding protein [Spirochaetales bacterium]|nr:zinc ABC transporter substrate-binding protein [Spirochaetales bacterium]